MQVIGTWTRLLRVSQWSKNAVVFAAFVFGNPVVEHALARSVLAFIAFCAASSSGYILNDIVDAPNDRHHPIKRFRPLASGQVSIPVGKAAGMGLLVLGLGLAWWINTELLAVIAIYLVLTALYSWRLKRIVLLDAFVISFGFILRAAAGAAAVEVPVSPWLMLCTLLLALFLAFGKRRSELITLGTEASQHRSALAGYSVPFLDQLLVILTAMTIMAYSIYSLTSDTVPGNGAMMFSIPLVMFAMFRYLYLVMQKGEGGAPEALLWRDWPLLATVASWALLVLAIMSLY